MNNKTDDDRVVELADENLQLREANAVFSTREAGANKQQVVTLGGGFCTDGCVHAYPVRPVGTPPLPCVRCGRVPVDAVDVYFGVDVVYSQHVANPPESNHQAEIELVKRWRASAKESREEAVRIRRTVKAATDAEERCNVRSEMWELCANELAAVIR